MVIEYIERDEHGQDWAVARVMLASGEPDAKRWVKLVADAFASHARALFAARGILSATWPETEPS